MRPSDEEAPPSCFPDREVEDDVFLGGSHLSVIYRNGTFGRAPVGLDVGPVLGLRPGKRLLLFFFLFNSFSFSSVFYLLI
jgi:hypothetical protein